MKILVTGPDGLLGNNLIRELIHRKYKVIAMMQKSNISDTLVGLPITCRQCDLLEQEKLQAITNDVDVIIHCAANTAMYPARSQAVNEVNIRGTQNILEACLKNKVKRLIVVGTANSFGPGTKDFPGDETKAYCGACYGLDYMDSKYTAMQLVKEYVKKYDLNAVMVHPTFMIGPYDSRPSSGEMILGVYKRKVPGYTTGGKNFVPVKDVATGIANAIDSGRKGESYILGGENLTYHEAFQKMAKILDVKPPKIKLSSSLVISIGWLNSTTAKLFKYEPKLTYELSRLATEDHYYSSSKAINELGFPQTSIEVAIEECKEWFEKNGYLKM